MNDIQQGARPFFEQIQIQIIGAEMRDVMFKPDPVTTKRRKAGFRVLHFLAQGEIGEKTSIALNGVIGEIGEHACANNGKNNLPGAMLEFVVNAHGGMESQRRLFGQ